MNTEQTVSLSADDSDDTAATASTLPSPRTRWAAIVWGVFFVALAWLGLWLLNDADRRDGVTDAIATLIPGTITAISLLSMGVLLLIAGLVGLIRRAQRRFADAS